MGNETAANATAGFVDWYQDPANQVWVRLAWTAIILLIWWALNRGVERSLVGSAKRLAKHRQLDDYTTRAAIGRTKPLRIAVKVATFIIAIIALLGVWGLQTAFTGILAGAGFAGIVVGLAAGDIIGDLLAGFLLMLRGPFDVGDWVEVDGIQGIVQEVAMQDTTLLTFDNEKVTIPNRLVEGSKIRNFTHERKLRFKVPVGVAYGTDLSKVRKILEEIGREHGEVMNDPAPMGVVIGFGASSVEMELRVWVEPVRNSVLKVRHDLLQMVHDRFRANDIEIAFPHMHIVQGEPFRVKQE